MGLRVDVRVVVRARACVLGALWDKSRVVFARVGEMPSRKSPAGGGKARAVSGGVQKKTPAKQSAPAPATDSGAGPSNTTPPAAAPAASGTPPPTGGGGGGGNGNGNDDALSDLPVLVVCDDQRDARTWAEMEEEMRKIQEAQKERKRSVGKRATWNKVRLFDAATNLKNQAIERWKKDNPGRGSGAAVPDDVKAKAANAAARTVYPGPYLANLPEYKCMARALTREERAEQTKTRERINDARLSNDGAHRELSTELLDDNEILDLGALIGAPTTLPSLAGEYVDFMNEERRDIIGTIRRARLRLRHEPRTEDLEEQEAIDQRELYDPLFQDERLPGADAASGASGDADPASAPNLVQGGHVVCLNTPRVAFEGDGVKDPAALAAGGEAREVGEREDRSRQAIYERTKEPKPLPNRPKASDKGKAPAKQAANSVFKGFDLTINPLADQNDCRPCEEWPLFYEKEEVLANGKKVKSRYKSKTYYQGMLRVMQVRNEIFLKQNNGHAVPEFQYEAAFEEDPLIKSGALDALYANHVGKAKYDSKRVYRAENLFKSELLRCFPVQKAADDPSLNRIIDFLCWYHVNVALRGKEGVEQDRTKGDENQQQVALLYRLLCCPNCIGKFAYADETEKPLVDARRKVHERVQELNSYFTELKNALDDDVLNQPDNSKSLLWNFRASDPDMNAYVRAEVYNRWSELNPRST